MWPVVPQNILDGCCSHAFPAESIHAAGCHPMQAGKASPSCSTLSWLQRAHSCTTATHSTHQCRMALTSVSNSHLDLTLTHWQMLQQMRGLPGSRRPHTKTALIQEYPRSIQPPCTDFTAPAHQAGWPSHGAPCPCWHQSFDGKVRYIPRCC